MKIRKYHGPMDGRMDCKKCYFDADAMCFFFLSSSFQKMTILVGKTSQWNACISRGDQFHFFAFYKRTSSAVQQSGIDLPRT